MTKEARESLLTVKGLIDRVEKGKNEALQTKKFQSKMRFVGHGSQRLCDRGFTEGAKDADDAISQRVHNPGGMVCSDRGVVFTKGDITDIVEAVFNAPMAAIQLGGQRVASQLLNNDGYKIKTDNNLTRTSRKEGLIKWINGLCQIYFAHH